MSSINKSIFRTLLLLSVLTLTGHRLWAQSSEIPLMSSRADFVRMQLNPSYIPKDANLIIGIPLLSDIGASAHVPFTLSDVAKPSEDKQLLRIYYDRLIKSLSGNNLGLDAQVNLLQFGFRTDIGFFTFSFGLKGSAFASIDKTFGELLSEGNMNTLGEWKRGRMGSMSAQVYNELAIGYATDKILEDARLQVGARLKLLGGQLYAELVDSDFGLYTSASGDELRFEVYQTGYINAKSRPSTNAKNMIDWSTADIPSSVKPRVPSSYGFGVDLGASYKFNDQWSVSLSMRDLGFIHWGGTNVLAEDLTGDKAISFKGIDISNELTSTHGKKTKSDVIETMKNAFSDNFTYQDDRDISSRLNANFHAGVTYSPIEKVTISGLVGSSRILGRWRPDVALSTYWQPWDLLGTAVSVSTLHGAPVTMGWGLVLGNQLQFHFGVNHILPFNLISLQGRAGLSLRF
ncbi:DUF5723 family protein [Porphyromonas sp.]|uniref:DUF5723 family protein n=1 Tax=Porphyromonas sp. TaxID=1924944 RepID=UPI0026DDAC18|nr:DUF5723 family protein [Porphyromonas sp.]MDO4770748.1 DUF5723 family protein [Porphyromonas sp.]